jgi:hypothetical protein
MSDPAGNRVSLANVPSGYGIAATAKASGTVLVTVGGQDITMQAPRDVAIAAGDPVSFVRFNGLWLVVQRYGVSAPVPPVEPLPPPPSPKPTIVTGTRTFNPVETRSRQGTKWRTDNDDVYQGQYGGNGNHVGCSFYGQGPRSLAGATVLSASIKAKRRSAGGITAAQSTTLWLVTQKTRPSGAPTLGSSTSGPRLKWGASGTLTLPTSWAQSMVDGTAGGLALYDSSGSPYVILEGRGGYGAAFSLTIRYQR